MAAPMDLNVPFCESELLLKKVLMASKLGYEVIAINNDMPSLLTHSKKKANVNILNPDDIKISQKVLEDEIGPGRKPMKLLSRISTRLEDIGQAHLLSSDKIQMYDLIAVTPTSEKTMRAFQRGVHFELRYSPAIRDNTMRRYLISAAESLVFAGKGKNLILTSGCEKPIEIRGPHDVANLGNLLFLTEGQTKNAVTTNCRALLCHSKARKAVQSVIEIEKMDSLSASDTWLLDKCRVDVNSATNTSDISEKDKTSHEPVKQKHENHSSDEPVKKKQKIKHKQKTDISPNKREKQ